MKTTDDDLLYHVEDGIGIITLNRPRARNALTFDMYEQIRQICARAGTADDPDSISALVITASGEMAFAAGTDIGHFVEFDSLEHAVEYEDRMEVILQQIEDCAVPVITTLFGAVTGGGGAIAAASHLRLGVADMKLGMPIARTLGNCLSVRNLKRFVDLIGESRLMYLMLTTEMIDAEAAQTAGFLHEVCADKQAMMERAMELARRIGTLAPQTVRSSREGMRRLRARQEWPDDHDLLEWSYCSADFQEGVSAFLEKRKPRWQGR